MKKPVFEQPKNHMRVLVVCMVGLPGSGKSSIAKSLLTHRDVSNPETNTNMIKNIHLIEFDLIEKEIKQNEEELDDIECWRRARVVAKKRFSELLREIMHNMDDDDDSSSSPLVTLPMTNKFNDDYQQLLSSGNKEKEDDEVVTVIVLDDNFHLRSMRREIYRICQNVVYGTSDETIDKTPIIADNIQFINNNNNNNIGICFVVVDTPVEVCKIRNDERANEENKVVASSVIDKMAKILEYPDQTKASWEAGNIIIIFEGGGYQETTTKSNNNHIVSYGGGTRPSVPDILRQCIQQGIYNLVRPPPPPDDSEHRNADREKLTKNQTHKVDRFLRLLVNIVCKCDKTLAKDVNCLRKSVLEAVRSGTALDNEEDPIEYCRKRFLDCTATKMNVKKIDDSTHKLREIQNLIRNASL